MTPEEQAAADAAAAEAAKGDIAAQIAAAVAKEVGGLKAKNEELLGTNKKLKDSMAAFEGIDPVKTKEMLKHFEGSEEAKLMAEGKIDEVIARRTQRRDEEVARQIADAQAQVEAAKVNSTKFHTRLLQGEIRAAAPADHHQAAMEDALRHAAEVFKMDDEGNIVPKDGKFGKDGKTPYTLKEWFEDTRATHPHRFTNGNTGSSGFNGSGKGTAKTISREKFQALDPQARAATVKSGIQIIDR
jgi:hypothetical protein